MDKKEFYYIYIKYYNPVAHDIKWAFISNKNEECTDIEFAKKFETVKAAENWINSEEAKVWLPCEFFIKIGKYD